MFSSNTSQVSSAANYIEDVFNTWLFNAGASFLDQVSVNNGVDYTKGAALTITKTRSVSGVPAWVDTVRGQDYSLWSSSTSAQNYQATGVINGLTSSGFTWLTGSGQGGATVASWTFRKQPKFFDVVTYTGNGSNQTIPHSLGSVPGCIIVKCISNDANWAVYHRSLGSPLKFLQLNTTIDASNAFVWNNTDPTSTVFSVGNDTQTNGSGRTYVAYLFAHNAGGFGLTGTDNVISCGSFTVDGSGNSSINLGYEPQWLLMKQTNTTGSWLMQDTMRGQTADNGYARLLADTSGAETSTTTGFIRINATGFSTNGATGLVGDHIYIAIRRGPMKTPTTGTSVFQPTTWTGTGAALQQNVNINYDSFMQWRRNGGYSTPWMDRLRGFGYSLYTQQTTAEVNQTAFIAGTLRNNFVNFVDGTYNLNGEPWLNYAFVRAPGFFDVVCFTGTGGFQTVSHNLGVAPEIVIFKGRGSPATNWITLATSISAFGYLNNALAVNNDPTTYFTTNGSTYAAPTSTSIFLNNLNASTYVAYLFASCPGVSKVFSFTGNGSSQTINCGFTGGSRLVLIKRTDSTGNWVIFDSARGIVAGNDPALYLNSTAAEVTGVDAVDTDSTGFIVNQETTFNLNVNNATYIGLAIS